MKKLIPALCMLLIAASMLGTSTFAWFSMNTSVSATGMQITAKSDSSYLLISSSKTTAADIQTEGVTTAALTVSADAAKMLPAAHGTLTKTSDATTAANWYYKKADSPKASSSEGSEIALTDLNFANYVIHDTAYICLASGSKATGALTVSASFESNKTATGSSTTFEPVKVVVTTSSAYVELTTESTSSTTALASTVTDSSVIVVDIFIYYDGSNTNVYTGNVKNLDGATIELTFTAADA